MDTKDEALKIAIEHIDRNYHDEKFVINACKEALEQPASSDDIPKGVLQAIDRYGLSLLKTANGFELKKLGKTEALSALEQPAQEPVAWGMERMGMILDCIHPEEHAREEGEYTIPLYTHPHQWQGLTDDEIEKVFESIETSTTHRKIYRAIEQALKEKNKC